MGVLGRWGEVGARRGRELESPVGDEPRLLERSWAQGLNLGLDRLGFGCYRRQADT
jgi:hypothetical protein